MPCHYRYACMHVRMLRLLPPRRNNVRFEHCGVEPHIAQWRDPNHCEPCKADGLKRDISAIVWANLAYAISPWGREGEWERGWRCVWYMEFVVKVCGVVFHVWVVAYMCRFCFVFRFGSFFEVCLIMCSRRSNVITFRPFRPSFGTRSCDWVETQRPRGMT